MSKVIVIGGSRGIGAACVRKFSSGGDRVAFIYSRSVEAALELARKTGAAAIRADISDPDQARRAITEAIGSLGGLDTVVACAGVAQIRLFTDLSDEDWNHVMNTDLNGTAHCIRAAVPALIRQHAGSVILVGSMWGKVGASCEVAYSAAKAGLRGLTMALAKELGPSGITVNIVEPGVIDTEMNAGLDEAVRKELCEETPLCRMGQPEEVADLIGFLASDRARFITGQAIGIDGGFAAGS